MRCVRLHCRLAILTPIALHVDFVVSEASSSMQSFASLYNKSTREAGWPEGRSMSTIP